MKEFEAGRTYKVNDINNSTVKVEKITGRYVTISGDYTGRYYRYRDNFFRLGEEIIIKKGKAEYFCFAGKEA